MAENTMPSLTLTPEEHETAAAVAEAPTLSLDPLSLIHISEPTRH